MVASSKPGVQREGGNDEYWQECNPHYYAQQQGYPVNMKRRPEVPDMEELPEEAVVKR